MNARLKYFFTRYIYNGFLILILSKVLLGFFFFFKKAFPSIDLLLIRVKTERVGHIIGDLEVFLRRYHRQPSSERIDKKKHWYFITYNPANAQLITMIRRQGNSIICSKLFYDVISRLLQNKRHSRYISSIPGHKSIYRILNETPSILSFTSEEEGRGNAILKEFGITRHSYISFHVRENAYLNKIMPGVDHSYHDYRDANLENYLDMVRTFANKGCSVIRMGSVVDKKMPDLSSSLVGARGKVIDYPSSKFLSDFADVFLIVNSKFFISSNSGVNLIGACFKVPAVWVNVAPCGYAPWIKGDLFIPKKYWSIDKNRMLTFKEIIALGADTFTFAKDFKNAGIKLIENTPLEIREVCEEMNSRLDMTWEENHEDVLLQKAFWKLWPEGHHLTHAPCKIGTLFLRNNRELLD